MIMKKFTAAQHTIPAVIVAMALALLIGCSDGSNGGSGLSGAAGNGDGGGDGSEANIVRIEAGENFQSRLIEALIGARPGDIVEI